MTCRLLEHRQFLYFVSGMLKNGHIYCCQRVEEKVGGRNFLLIYRRVREKGGEGGGKKVSFCFLQVELVSSSSPQRFRERERKLMMKSWEAY